MPSSGPLSFDPLIDPIRRQVAELGFELVDLKRSGPSQRPILQIRIDRPEGAPGQGVTTGDCVLVSRALERWLEGEAGVGPRYVLEVSSPGIERPLRWPEQWRRFVGREARVRSRLLPGHPRVTIVGVPDDEHVTLRLPSGEDATVPFAEIREAKLAVDWNTFGKRQGERDV